MVSTSLTGDVTVIVVDLSNFKIFRTHEAAHGDALISGVSASNTRYCSSAVSDDQAHINIWHLESGLYGVKITH